MSGVTEEGGAAEVEQQQQHESPPRVPHPPERPRRDVRPPAMYPRPLRASGSRELTGSVTVTSQIQTAPESRSRTARSAVLPSTGL
ncbi:hypothetical protein CLOP_g24382 [Closterium sp. NIES-67]|nr:hypothetical protein CLOP_g24382 [Closterium sp. NIES-67]